MILFKNSILIHSIYVICDTRFQLYLKQTATSITNLSINFSGCQYFIGL